MSKKKKRPPRDIRIKVYVTDNELNKLHDISEEQETTISNLCRECALSDDLTFITSLKIDDTLSLIGEVNRIDSMVQDFIKLLAQSPLYTTEIKDINSLLTSINNAHLKVRNVVLGKRKKIRSRAVLLLKQFLREDLDVYRTPAGKFMHSISVSVTQKEYKSIKEIAETIGCSMSVYLKRCVLIRYGKGRIEIRTDALDELTYDLNYQSRFLEAIVSEVKKRYPEDGDINAVSDILKRCVTLIENRKESIDTSTKEIRFEAEILVKEFLMR